MPAILHYTQADGNAEYVVITDRDDNKETRESFREPGYEFYSSYEIEETGTLPTERSLYPG
jgi:hypothetical protein